MMTDSHIDYTRGIVTLYYDDRTVKYAVDTIHTATGWVSGYRVREYDGWGYLSDCVYADVAGQIECTATSRVGRVDHEPYLAALHLWGVPCQ